MLGICFFFFFLRILNIFNIHRENGVLKKTYKNETS